jgi:hypothetical protein
MDTRLQKQPNCLCTGDGVLVSPFVSAERLVGGKRRKLSKLVTQSEKKSHKKMQAEEREKRENKGRKKTKGTVGNRE